MDANVPDEDDDANTHTCHGMHLLLRHRIHPPTFAEIA